MSVLAEESGGSWHELVRCDEHLKNDKGYLGGSPIGPVAGWRAAGEGTTSIEEVLRVTSGSGDD